MCVLGKIERMVGSRKRGLQIAQEGVYRTKFLQLHAGGTAACDGAIMGGTRSRDGLKAPQPIGNDVRLSGQRLLRPLGHRVFGKFQLGQASKQRMAGFRCLHRSDKGHFILRTAPALAAGQLAPQIGIIDLDAAFELARFFTHAHDLHQLVFHQPGRLVAHTQVAFEFQRRNTVLRLAQQMHGQKPACQRQLGGLEYRAADRGGLLPARGALPVLQPLIPFPVKEAYNHDHQ